jgi:hypothetical protein
VLVAGGHRRVRPAHDAHDSALRHPEQQQDGRAVCRASWRRRSGTPARSSSCFQCLWSGVSLSCGAQE